MTTFTYDEVLALVDKAKESISLIGLNPISEEFMKSGLAHFVNELMQAEFIKSKAEYDAAMNHLAGCDAKQAPEQSGVNPSEFFVCECGKVGDADDARSNELYPEPRCQECWDMLCDQDPAGTDTLDADGDL